MEHIVLLIAEARMTFCVPNIIYKTALSDKLKGQEVAFFRLWTLGSVTASQPVNAVDAKVEVLFLEPDGFQNVAIVGFPHFCYGVVFGGNGFAVKSLFKKNVGFFDHSSWRTP